MLRPAVAATNCARAGKASGLDIGRRRLSMEKAGSGHAGRDRRRQSARAAARPSTTARKQRYRAIRGRPRLSHATVAGKRRNFGRDPALIPDKTSLFRRISKAPADIMMTRLGRRHTTARNRSLLKIGWLPMDTSHLAEHAGTAGSLFASVFVVATDHDADHDPAAGVRHSHQHRADRDRDPEPQLSGHPGADAWCWCSIPTGCTRCCSWCAT